MSRTTKPSSSSLDSFAGFDGPEENWSSLPNTLIALIPHLQSLPEMQVLVITFARCWISHRSITMQDLLQAGMDQQAAEAGLTSAVQNGYLTKNGDGWGIVYTDDRNTELPLLTGRHLTREIKRTVRLLFGSRCAYCGQYADEYHYDHIVPHSRGGPTCLGNLALACAACNFSKHDRTPDEWGHQPITKDGQEYAVWREFLPEGEA